MSSKLIGRLNITKKRLEINTKRMLERIICGKITSKECLHCILDCKLFPGCLTGKYFCFCFFVFFLNIFITTFVYMYRGGGGTPLYKPYRYVPPHRVEFLRCFGLKTGVHFAHFGLERVWFPKERRIVWMYLSFQFQIRKKEREICEFEMNLKNCFVCAVI